MPVSAHDRVVDGSVLCQVALDRLLAVDPLLRVGAVVVDPVVALHPLHLPSLRGAQLARSVVLRGGRRAAGGAAAGAALAEVEVDVVVVGDEGRLGPVGLDAAALRGPVLGRPDAGVGEHRPARRERHAVARLVVAEHPDGDAVDVPPANDASMYRRCQWIDRSLVVVVVVAAAV